MYENESEWGWETDAEGSSSGSSCSSSGRTSFNDSTWSGSGPQWSAIRAACSTGGLELRHLKLVRHLGSGNLGRVFLCRLRGCDSAAAGLFAMKVVDTESLSPKMASQARTEAHILACLHHPFLPTLYARIQASRYTCLLIDYCPRGDLHSLVGRLSMPAVRFVAAQVLTALQYLHSLGIVYRDLKPENILLRADAHIMLSDFDLCFTTPRTQPYVHHNEVVAEPTGAWSRSCVGTHEYLAPEVVAGTGHGSPVDWWAFGVLLYDLIHGTTPFKGPTNDATLRNIVSDSTPLKLATTTRRHRHAHNLIRSLLVRDPTKRLGATLGAAQIKHHPFFRGIKWPLIRNTTPPPDLLNPNPRIKPRCWTNLFSS